MKSAGQKDRRGENLKARRGMKNHSRSNRLSLGTLTFSNFLQKRYCTKNKLAPIVSEQSYPNKRDFQKEKKQSKRQDPKCTLVVFTLFQTTTTIDTMDFGCGEGGKKITVPHSFLRHSSRDPTLFRNSNNSGHNGSPFFTKKCPK